LSDEQVRELCICLSPDFACRVEEHQRQQAAAIAGAGAEAQALRRMLLSQTIEVGAGAGAGTQAGRRAAEPMEVSLESEEAASEKDTDMEE